MPSAVERFLPLPHTELHVLLALCSQEMHGYAIMQRVRHGTSDQVRLGPGTLYGVIKRLLATGLIVEGKRRAAAAGDERRRYYRLTPLGRRVITAELERLTNILRAGVAAGAIPANRLIVEGLQ
jgi:DNA-binding PadR family transcriptional regulator